MKRYISIAILGAALLAGCNKENNTPDEGDNVPVQFSTAITKAAGTKWGGTDEIGVFMLTASGTALPGSIVDNGTPTAADNVKYTNSASGFTTATPIYYPNNGTNVDFVAYYPWRAKPATDTYIYKVSVADQTAPAAIDLLWSNNAKSKSRSKTAVGLEFKHALSRVVLNITKGEGMSAVDFSTLAVTITGMPTTADFALADGSFSNLAGAATDITPRTITAGTTYEAIVIPQSGSTGRSITFTVSGETYTYPLPTTDDFTGGKNYPYTVTVKKSGVTVSRGAITDWTGTTGTPDDLGEAEDLIKKYNLVKIPAGTFMMGSSDGTNISNGDGSGLNTTTAEPDRETNETQHSVTLTKDFYMSKYQITNAQYAAFLNAKGVGSDGKCTWGANSGQTMISTFAHGVKYNGNKWVSNNSGTYYYDNYPVVSVTWYGATEYANWIGGSLATEAQWEYACRAGTTTSYSFGAGDTNIDNYAWYSSNSGNHTNTVGLKQPNTWGLYDMHGNVWEWCLDSWDGSAYSAAAATDPISPNAGANRVLRGGSWRSNAQDCRSAYRLYSFPVIASNFFGFRVVFVP